MRTTFADQEQQTFITIAQMRQHLRIVADDPDEIAMVMAQVDAAIMYAQQAMGCSLMPQTVTTTWDSGDLLYLPYGPIIGMDTVSYGPILNSESAESSESSETSESEPLIRAAIVSPVSYIVESSGNLDRLRFNYMYQNPYMDQMTAIYTAGYRRQRIPADIRQAILMHAGTLYEHRESIAADKRIEVIPNGLEQFYRVRSRSVGIG